LSGFPGRPVSATAASRAQRPSSASWSSA
jgi:hypothetical protein